MQMAVRASLDQAGWIRIPYPPPIAVYTSWGISYGPGFALYTLPQVNVGRSYMATPLDSLVCISVVRAIADSGRPTSRNLG